MVLILVTIYADPVGWASSLARVMRDGCGSAHPPASHSVSFLASRDETDGMALAIHLARSLCCRDPCEPTHPLGAGRVRRLAINPAGALVLLAAWAPSMAGWFYDYVLSVPIIANTLVVFGDLVACSVGAHMGWCQSFGAGPIILAVHPRVFDGPCWPGAPPRPLWTFS